MAETTPEQGGEKTLSPAEKAALRKKEALAKAKAKAADKKPLVDNGDGTITDPNTGFMWKQTDAWLDTQRFYTWAMHKEYVDKINKENFADYSDWRIPSKAEALTIFDKTKECVDKNGTTFTMDPIFTEGCVSNTWISECSDDNIIRFDLKIGIDTPYTTSDIYGSIRLVRIPAKEEPKEEPKEESKEKPKEEIKEEVKDPQQQT